MERSLKHVLHPQPTMLGAARRDWIPEPLHPPASVPSPPSHLSPWLAPVATSLNDRVLLPLYFSQIEVHGIEHLPRSGAVILAPTHRSRWDGFVVSYAAGRRSMTGRYLHFMITANEMRGSQGWILRRLGGFAIDPQRPGVSSLRYGIELLQQGSPLVIFPEGGNLPKNRQFSLNRLHPGLARLAIQATLSQSEPSVLVVPIAIDYNHPQMAWRCQVQVRIGAPLSVSQYLTSNPKHSAHSLTVALATALQGLTHYQGPSQGPSQGNTAIPWET